MQSFNESAHFLEQNAFLSALSALLQSVFSSYLVSRLQSAVLSYPQKQERLAAFGTHLDAISGKVVALCLEEAAHTLRQQHLAFPPPPAPPLTASPQMPRTAHGHQRRPSHHTPLTAPSLHAFTMQSYRPPLSPLREANLCTLASVVEEI